MSIDAASMRAFRAPAAEICDPLPLSDAARSLLQPDAAPGVYAAHLWYAVLHDDLALFLAHGLTTSDAVWWGHACALAIDLAQPDPAVGPVLDLVGDWSLSPSPELEQEAALLACELDMEPPAAWVALAVSLARPPDPELGDRYRLGVSTAIAAAVQIAATIGPSRGLGARGANLRSYLERGFDIARGGDAGVDRLNPPMFPGLRRNPRVPRAWLEEA